MRSELLIFFNRRSCVLTTALNRYVKEHIGNGALEEGILVTMPLSILEETYKEVLEVASELEAH